MSDYGLKITIHDLDSAVEDAVCRAHREYEPKFYDWMRSEIEAHVDDAIYARRDSDNANTEQQVGVNEVESMIDAAIEGIGIENAVSDVIDNLDFEMLVRDYGNVHSIVEDYIYNNDIVDKCWVEDELGKVHRDVRDEVLADIRDEIDSIYQEAVNNLRAETVGIQSESITSLRADIMSLQAGIDFLHEKHVENVERRLSSRIAKAWDSFTLTLRRVVRMIPRITITKGGA